ncbi:MAG: 2-dehydropantoate 2-reductase [Verrucomicrobia bacterium]|nr:2-dehydropantoate 2-reductase [Verrucomicrobiota bacterium]
MKMAVVGCGALGSFYGAKLCRAGEEAHFLLRSDYDVVRTQGVRVRSIHGDFHVHPRCARWPEEIGVVDLVVIGLKTTANTELPKLLPPLVGRETLVVTLQNGLGNEEQLAALFGPENILGGLCFVCLNRLEPGLIHHTAHGKVVLGELGRPPLARTHALAERFRHAGIPCTVTENLAAAHWEKLVWNIPFNGLGVAGAAGYDAVVRGNVPTDQPPGPCLATDALLNDARWERLVRELMWEVVMAARAHGYAIPDAVVDHQVDRTRVMAAYKASTLIDFERGLPLELESMFLEPQRQARALGVPTPRLAAMNRILAALEERTLSRE